MKLVVGLGNPDKQYENTFHNLGFMAVEKTAQKLGVVFDKERFNSMIADVVVASEKILLVKPLTYMNLSGCAVKEIVDYYKIDLKDIVVIYDDYDLPKGNIRIREFGSAGSHNGMRNIVKELQSEKFARIRIGFKPNGENNIPLINYVLSKIDKSDVPIFAKATEFAGEAGVEFAHGTDISSIMQRYNKCVL